MAISAVHNPLDWANREDPKTICLFDVDGTLSLSRKTASKEMIDMLLALKKKVVIGFVGGSDLCKQIEQLGENAATELFDFGFAENGVTAYRLGNLICQESFIKFLGEDKYKELLKFTLHYLADLDIPLKRGTFIEYRNGMINISPIGRNCSYEERLAFAELDAKEGIRPKLVEKLREKFDAYGLQFSIGGQISIDVFPKGWDKTFCLKHLEGEGFETIHFFGDKTAPGGNDHEIYHHPKVQGHAVKNPSDTMDQLRQLFLLKSVKKSNSRFRIAIIVFVLTLAISLALKYTDKQVFANGLLGSISKLIIYTTWTASFLQGQLHKKLIQLSRKGKSPLLRFNRPSIKKLAQQTKGRQCISLLMGLLDDAFLELFGRSYADIKEPVKKYWEKSSKYRTPVKNVAMKAYETVPRCDLVLTAVGTALTVMAVRRSLRRFRTAQEIPMDYFRRQKKLKGYALCVNDSDNLRFYHNSAVSSFFWRRPAVKRTDIKYQTINVRLAGIDAPEMAHFGGDNQPYAKEAKAWLTKFVEGKRITIELFRYDQYSRAVAAVYVGLIFRKNVSVEMVKAGFATIYEDSGAQYGKFEVDLRKHLKEAQSKRKGMWQQHPANYVSPSQYKKNLKLLQETPTSQAASKDSWKLQRFAFWK